MVEIGEAVETGENVEIANIHAVFWHIVENRAGWQRWLGEYPTLSAIFRYFLLFASYDASFLGVCFVLGCGLLRAQSGGTLSLEGRNVRVVSAPLRRREKRECRLASR